MNLSQLKAFLAVAQDGGFSRAAEKLYLTQPAVSKQIQALEEARETINQLRGLHGGRTLSLAAQEFCSLLRRSAVGRRKTASPHTVAPWTVPHRALQGNRLRFGLDQNSRTGSTI